MKPRSTSKANGRRCIKTAPTTLQSEDPMEMSSNENGSQQPLQAVDARLCPSPSTSISPRTAPTLSQRPSRTADPKANLNLNLPIMKPTSPSRTPLHAGGFPGWKTLHPSTSPRPSSKRLPSRPTGTPSYGHHRSSWQSPPRTPLAGNAHLVLLATEGRLSPSE